MGIYISAAVDAEDVISGMNESGEFLQEMLEGFAEGLQRGMLLDNTLDVFRGLNNDMQDLIVSEFQTLVDMMKSEVENRE